MLQIAIVEDDQIYADQLKHYIDAYMEVHALDYRITYFEDGEDIVENYRAEFDMILMDIQMQFLDGMSAAQKIREKDEDVMIIFITSVASYAIKGYEVKAFDYILKPVTPVAFEMKFERALDYLRQNEKTYITIPVQNGVQKIDVHSIYYIESQSHTMTFHTKNASIEARGKLDDYETQLARYGFYRSNRGYLVNMRHVTGVKDGCCVIGGDLLPISRRKKTEFMDLLVQSM